MTPLSLDNLSNSYGTQRVTDGVSVAVAAGEIAGIPGPNRAGKTTLFSLVAGTVRPDAGRVQFKGGNVTGPDAAAPCHRGISR